MSSNGLFDGLHVTDGPFRGSQIGALDDQALAYSRELAAQILCQVERGEGFCSTRKYPGWGWGEVENQDPDYYHWFIRTRRSNLAVYDAEIRRREEARQREAAAAAAQALPDAEPLYDDREQQLIREHNLLDGMEARYNAGFRQEAFKAHPDQGGSDERMRLLNEEKKLFRKLIDTLKRELMESVPAPKTK